jgi:hypothetical protein
VCWLNNVITLRLGILDHIIRMITTTYDTYLVTMSKEVFKIWPQYVDDIRIDYIKRLSLYKYMKIKFDSVKVKAALCNH